MVNWRPDHELSTVHLLGVAGSLRKRSYNRGLLQAIEELAPPGVTLETFDIGELPFFNADVEAAGDPSIVRAFKRAITDADAVVIATPEYLYSVPGVLKNAIDWASRPPGRCALRHKLVALLGASTGAFGTVRSQLALRQVLLGTESRVLARPEVYVADAPNRFNEDGRLVHEASRAMVAELLNDLVRAVLDQKSSGWPAGRAATDHPVHSRNEGINGS